MVLRVGVGPTLLVQCPFQSNLGYVQQDVISASSAPTHYDERAHMYCIVFYICVDLLLALLWLFMFLCSDG